MEANVDGGGPAGQAGAIRWGVAMGLRSFVDADTVDRMRLGEFFLSLLTRHYLLKLFLSVVQLAFCSEITERPKERSLAKRVLEGNSLGRSDK